MYFVWELNLLGQTRGAKVTDIYNMEGKIYKGIVQYHKLTDVQMLLTIQELMDLFPYNPKSAA